MCVGLERLVLSSGDLHTGEVGLKKNIGFVRSAQTFFVLKNIVEIDH